MNVCKTYVRSVYVLSPEECEGASKLVLLSKSYYTITCSKSTIDTLTQDVSSKSELDHYTETFRTIFNTLNNDCFYKLIQADSSVTKFSRINQVKFVEDSLKSA